MVCPLTTPLSQLEPSPLNLGFEHNFPHGSTAAPAWSPLHIFAHAYSFFSFSYDANSYFPLPTPHSILK